MSLKSNDPRDSRTWRKLRLVILARDQWTCHYCQQPATSIDHVIPVSQAPDQALNPENCVAACKRCNSSKGSRSAGVFLAPAFTPPVFPVSASLTRSKVHQDSPFTARPNPSS
jgi:5-methylcytosine-specific restriction endonuclease McrA